MNRERILFVGVLAIIALWALVMREKPDLSGDPKPNKAVLTSYEAGSADYATVNVRTSGRGVFTRITNEEPHPRPTLHDPDESKPDVPKLAARALPSLWLPTSRSVSVDRYGALRRPYTKAGEDGTLSLPAAPNRAAVGAAGDKAGLRIDEWNAFGQQQKGRVVALRVNGKVLETPRSLPEVGAEALNSEFHRLTAMLAVNPQAAANEGVTEVQVRIRIGGKEQGKTWLQFPAQLGGLQIGHPEGGETGWWRGMLVAVRLPSAGFKERERKGGQLLQAGVNEKNNVLLQWALFLLGDAKARVPEADRVALKPILLKMMDAANRLNRQEQVLSLAIEHLDKFPQEEDVLVYLGNILSSRSFNLQQLAAAMFERAPRSAYAQRRRVEVLLAMGNVAEAGQVLAAGSIGGGAAADLLHARVALAKGDFDEAVRRAQGRTGGEMGAEAHQILGAAAYAQGDAAVAERSFLEAVRADPGRSTAYSDLGLALMVQGRLNDAKLCFDRALELDAVDNAVIPQLAVAVGKLEAGDESAAATLNTLATDTFPANLLVRFFHGYAKEKAGDLTGAAELYRAVLDDDHRYRVAIARLGMVESRRVEEGESEVSTIKAAVAHLRKAVELNPKDALLPYVLGRFLMGLPPEQLVQSGVSNSLADKMFARSASLKAAGDANLPLWAAAARAGLSYRDKSEEERKVKAKLQGVRQSVVDLSPPGTPEQQLLQHPVYAYATQCLAIVRENETKVDLTWTFGGTARDWKIKRIAPADVRVRGGALVFGGTVDFKGGDISPWLPLNFSSAMYPAKGGGINASRFYELKVQGAIPDGQHTVGVGLLAKSSRDKWTGIQVRRKGRTGNMEVLIEGAEHDSIKKVRGRAYVELTQVKWPTGDFTLHLKLQGTGRERRQGRFILLLNGVNVFQQEFGDKNLAERSSVFRGSRSMNIVLWSEGPDGTDYPKGLKVTKVVLTQSQSNK